MLFPPFSSLGILENQLITDAYIWTFDSIPLIFMSILVPVSYCPYLSSVVKNVILHASVSSLRLNHECPQTVVIRQCLNSESLSNFFHAAWLSHLLNLSELVFLRASLINIRITLSSFLPHIFSSLFPFLTWKTETVPHLSPDQDSVWYKVNTECAFAEWMNGPSCWRTREQGFRCAHTAGSK